LESSHQESRWRGPRERLKIGRAGDIETRRSQFMTGNPEDIKRA